MCNFSRQGHIVTAIEHIAAFMGVLENGKKPVVKLG